MWVFPEGRRPVRRTDEHRLGRTPEVLPETSHAARGAVREPALPEPARPPPPPADASGLAAAARPVPTADRQVARPGAGAARRGRGPDPGSVGGRLPGGEPLRAAAGGVVPGVAPGDHG